MKVYERLRQAYPGKRIVIAEFGWPSAGLNRKDAEPSPLTQAQIVRDFVARADAMGIDYSIVEAFDQPWKTNEGSVGPYWGIFDADRNPKFAFAGTVETPNFLLKMMAALAIGLLLSIPIFGIPRRDRGTSRRACPHRQCHRRLVGQCHRLLGHALFRARLADRAVRRRRTAGAAHHDHEAAHRRACRHPVRRQRPPAAHARRRPAGARRRSCRSISPPAASRPRCCGRRSMPWPRSTGPISNAWWSSTTRPIPPCGPRSRTTAGCSARASNSCAPTGCKGFKAGALRLALEHTAPEAEIIGVLDADYVVHPDWLKDLVPAFADPAVGLVQAPQDHRDASRTVTQVAMNREYAGFFDIGMVERNEVNAIVVHGTMCLIRREALDRRRQLVERHHRRGYRSRAVAARAGMARALHAKPLWLGSAAVRLRRL